MNNILHRYFSDRYPEDANTKTTKGPVITISREYGCPSKLLALSIANRLNIKKKSPVKWRLVNKEILTKSAEDLRTVERDIKYVFDYEKRTMIDDILASHGRKYYLSDKKIRQTVGEVIRSFAEEGYVIIVGRGGVAIASQIPKSLHIKMIAPFEWRMKQVAKKYNLSEKEAAQTCRSYDEKRKSFLEYYLKDTCLPCSFDVLLNCSRFSIEQMSDMVYKAMKVKKLF